MMAEFPRLAPEPGEIVRVRQRQYLVEEVAPSPEPGEATLVSMSCIDDDAQGEPLEVLWELELDSEVVRASWDKLGRRSFDAPSRFAAYLHALRWNCVTAATPRLFQAPWRAGIEVMAYQLEPLRKALRLPRVNLFIADDVGLGKTIEAGLVLREMIMRQRVRRVVVAAPPSVVIQWRDELEQRFGLTFVIYDRSYVARVRRERGYAVNPWATHSRFIVSHALLRDEDYAAPLRDLLSTDDSGNTRDGADPGSLLILDEAHHAAPASSSKYAIDSQFTLAVRDLAERFEHRIFLSATPHNGLSNSFSALLEILDPQRFVRGAGVEPKLRDEVMVRRLKADLRGESGGFPIRRVIAVALGGLPADAPELALARLLDEYWEAREQRLEGLPPRQRAAQGLILVNLQKRLFSSVEAFYRTLSAHRRALERAADATPGAPALAPGTLELLLTPPDADDDRSELAEDDVDAAEEQAVEAATMTGAGKPSARELDLVTRMAELADRTRRLPDARVRWLVDWIRKELCPELPPLGSTASGPPAAWLPRRAVIFTEYADTKRYLEQQLRGAIGATDRGDDRLATFHGGMPDELREEVKRAFNADPEKHPLRILVATDAAREGVNLQNYCADLFHMDLPWNPSRLEQRNGRIDRKLQRAAEVHCHYFVYAQRDADRVLEVLAERTKVIQEELGSMPPVLEERMTRRLARGIGPRGRKELAEALRNMMGFRLEEASEASIGVGKQHVVVGLETLLRKNGAEREKHLKDLADVELSGSAAEALRAATTVDDLVAALGRRISPLTPRPVPTCGLYLQPTDERRRSGSHYTPRELTEPIVRTALRPILEDLGPTPTPAQILALKVCDPAMGSGAFLVETCRQLAEQLVKAYDVHGRPTDVPPDEHILLYAQRQVAQRCLYGVDKNPLAVDLGKLSLWLATLARDHAFTFLDHAIRHGDSLVGLSREQIASFHWAPEQQVPVIRAFIDKAIAEAMALRARIPELASSDDVEEKRRLLRDADDALAKVRLVGDVVLACFFSEEKARVREEERKRWEAKVLDWLSSGRYSNEMETFVGDLRGGEKPVPCFHWEVEYPEVFSRSVRGFDTFVGNPPFMGGNKIFAALRHYYGECLASLVPESGGRAVDLVAYFFRRTFSLLQARGGLGLIATKTIAQGDTRRAGLEWILCNGGMCYAAAKRRRWPGLANVVVSIVHISRTDHIRNVILDGKKVPGINSHLLPMCAELAPNVLLSNANIAFMGCHLYGAGFKFDDSDVAANPVRVMRGLVDKDARNSEVISKLIAGEDITTSIDHDSNRWTINFRDMSLDEAHRWPDVLNIVERKVRPERVRLGGYSVARSRADRWWIYGTYASSLYRALLKKRRCMALSQVSAHHSLVFHNPDNVFSHSVVVFVFDQDSAFAILQCRVHEIWARFFSSSMRDDLRYTPSDCFDTFSFPPNWDTNTSLEVVGLEYCNYKYRAELMIANNEGLTKIYNRFHDPDESGVDVIRLRELHAAMDRAVLDAYGWTDIQPTCEFLLDYEEEDDDAGASGGRRKKKPWRYRWPDDIRDEVLARLLELNAQRAKEQTLVAKPSKSRSSSSGKKRGTRAKKAESSEAQGALFAKEREE